MDAKPSEALPPERAAARRRRRLLLVVGLLLGAGVVVAAVVRPFRGVPTIQPGESEPLEEPVRATSMHPPGRKPEAPPPVQPPLPETYDGWKQEALAVGARLMERYPDISESFGLLAWMHFDFGNLDEATRCWEQWLERHPDSAEAHYRLGLYALRRGNDEEGVDCLQKAFSLDPTLPDIQAHLGKSLMKLGRTQDALAVLEKDVTGSRGDSVRYFLLGHAYLETEQYEKAKQAFNRAAEITPSFSGAYYGMATACTRLGQPEEAKKHLKAFQEWKSQEYVAKRTKVQEDEVLRLRRIVAVWYSVAGSVYAREGDLEQAEAHWLRAAAADPDQTASRQSLVGLYRAQGKTERAEQLAAELRRIASRKGE